MTFDDDHQNEYDIVFRSLSFPRYCPRPRPTQTQYLPATPRAAAAIFVHSGATPSTNSELSRASSSATGSSFFFTISSSSSSSSPAPSSTASSYRCTFRGKDTIGFRRSFPPNITPEKLKQRLSLIGSIRHANVVQLMGASISDKEPRVVDLMYGFVNSPTLSNCLNNHNANVNNLYSLYVSTWQSRIEIALGVARGLNYIHHMTGFDAVLVHNRIKSSNIILTFRSNNNNTSTAISQQPGVVRPLICKFGLAQAAGEAAADDDNQIGSWPTTMASIPESEEEENPYFSPELRRHEGTLATQKSDVYAFGMLLLELLSGAEPVAYYHYDEEENVHVRMSIVETARETLAGEDDERVRGWVDGRLIGFIPVKVAEKAMRVALHCLSEDPESRPDMGFVEGVICDCWINSK
ncbi:unnamed protein product [Linum trigynum]|uniref:Protein kinase domain-containing protein n=1 Tax=Linum trigynum TaxID=586398 RepID=A0AAV2DAS1_9ROSI